ncbi:MAG: hypothetical protein ACRC7W_03220 [Fusobacteriaceae bacterium]
MDNDGAEVETVQILSTEVETIWAARQFMSDKSGIPLEQLGWRVFPSSINKGKLNFIEISVNRPERYNGVEFNAPKLSVNALTVIYGAESPVVRDAIKRNLSAYYAGNIEPHSFAMSPAEWSELIAMMK